MSPSFINALNIKVVRCNLNLLSSKGISDLDVVICHANTLISVCNMARSKCSLTELLEICDLVTDLKVIILTAEHNKKILKGLN